MEARQGPGVRKLLLVLGAVAVLALMPQTGVGFGWSLIDAKIQHDFPQVKRITTAELATWLEDQPRAKALLLDVRTRAEYEVSRLAGAQHVETDASVSAIGAVRREQPIVTYCSVGYRSGAFAKKLIDAGK